MNTSGVRIKVSGELACFTRPETKVERFSYPVMTPSAARNILDAICWRPEMRWIVTSISVLKPIRYISVLRNEVQSKVSPASVRKWIKDPSQLKPIVAGAGTDTDGTPRNSVLLRDVAYVIEAYPKVYSDNPENSPEKYVAMMARRVAKGQCFHHPALGCREFVADFTHAEPEEKPEALTQDLGRMIYDVIFRESGNEAVFFDAKLINGVMETRPEIVLPDAARREELLRCSYKR